MTLSLCWTGVTDRPSPGPFLFAPVYYVSQAGLEMKSQTCAWACL